MYLTTISGGCALVAGLPKALGNAAKAFVTTFTELRKGNFQAACSSAGDIHSAVGKAHGAAATHGGHAKTAHMATK